ncbi:MAG: hypothetical protein KBF88_03110 [Polyangiaceae bacterium]|nr:hypothetical protein [Polyangiaceae bacterium]
MWQEHLRNSIRKQGGAALLVAAAIGSVMWVMRDQKGISDKEREDRKALLFPSFRRAELNAITLHQGPRTDMYAKDDRGWHLLGEKTKEDADDAALESLATRLEYAIPLRKVDDSLLGAVRLRGELYLGSVQYAFQVGTETTTPVGGAYVRVEHEGTFVVGREVAMELLQSLDTYRNRNIVPYLSIELSELRVSGSAPWKIERANEIDFTLSYERENLPSVRARASRKVLDTFWGGLAELRASMFFEGTPVGAPLLTIDFVPKNQGTPGKLELYERCGDKSGEILVRRVSPPPKKSICVPASRLQPLAKAPAEFLDEALFSSRLDEISEIRWSSLPSQEIARFARRDKTWRYQRSRKPEALDGSVASQDASDTWEIDDRDLAPFEASQLQVTLEGILRAKAIRAEGLAPVGPTESTVRILRQDDSSEEIAIHVANLDQEPHAFELVRSTAQFSTWPTRFTLSAFDQTYLAPPSLGGATPWSTPYRNADVTRIRSFCGTQEQVATRETGLFRSATVNGVKYGADHARLLDIADAVSTLKVRRWFTWPYAHQKDEALPCAPGTVRRLIIDHDGRSESILFCDPLDGDGTNGRTVGGFDQSPKNNLFFEFDGEYLKNVCKLWIDRGGVHVEPRNLKRVTLAGAGKSHSFMEGETSGGLRARDIFESAGLLHATDVLSTGPLSGDRIVFTASFEFEAEAGLARKQLRFYTHPTGYAVSVDASPVRYSIAESMIAPWLQLFQPVVPKGP